jgi:hypothetical protein
VSRHFFVYHGKLLKLSVTRAAPGASEESTLLLPKWPRADASKTWPTDKVRPKATTWKITQRSGFSSRGENRLED